MRKFSPSPEQAAILAFVSQSTDNGFFESGAGTGKTTLAIEVACTVLREVDGADILFVAFNNKIVKELQPRAPEGTEVRTMHSLGFRSVKRAFPHCDKPSRDYLFTLFAKRYTDRVIRERYPFLIAVKKLISFAKTQLVHDFDGLMVLAEEQELDLNGEVEEACRLAAAILDYQITSRPEGLDFDDQVWLPVVKSLPVEKFTHVIVDEAQDTNPVRRELVKRALKPNGRIFAVGDKRQAIYQFAGADEHAVDNMIAAFGMRTFPLKTTFRCGKRIVAEAQKIVPDFRAGENNPDGVVRSINADQLLQQVERGDFVLSRTNAPLVSYCLAALARGMRATIVGRDIGEQITGLAKKIVKKSGAENASEFEAGVAAWRDKEISRLANKIPVPESVIESVQDRAGVLLAVTADVDTLDEVFIALDKLFSDVDDATAITFSSTHRAKGLERDRVFMLTGTYCRMRRNKDGEWVEPKLEEYNLKYVAITRAKTELVYVTESR